MTKTYNVNIVGNLTNTYGVLSGFSTSNYATTPSSFTFSSYDWEFNIGFKTGDNISGDQNVVTPLADDKDKDAINIWVNSGRILVIICDSNNGQTILLAEIPCSVRTTYYIKCQYINGVYYIKQSSDGITYTNAVTPLTSTTLIWDTNQKWVFGCARGQNRPFYGTIDLNYCYLKINNAIVWRGVTETSQVITHIQLRRDISSTWATINPVLLEGEVGIETDTKKQKIGDGLTPWNNLQYDLGSTALQVSGGTMTGGLILEDTGATAVVQKYPNITYNTAPSSSNTYGGFAALDTNSAWMGIWAVERYTDNHTVIKMQGKSRTGTQGRLQLVSRPDGTWVAQAPTPLANSDTNEIATTEWARDIADGQPIAKYLLVDNTKTVHSASANLSSYINDSTTASYEVLVEVNIESNNTTKLWVGNVSDPYTNQHGNAFCIGTNTTSGATQQHFACWIPLATSSRTLYYQLAGSSASNAASVNLLGYRRLGTNS